MYMYRLLDRVLHTCTCSSWESVYTVICIYTTNNRLTVTVTKPIANGLYIHVHVHVCRHSFRVRGHYPDTDTCNIRYLLADI